MSGTKASALIFGSRSVERASLRAIRQQETP
jgi:hypothetical protein